MEGTGCHEGGAVTEGGCCERGCHKGGCHERRAMKAGVVNRGAIKRGCCGGSSSLINNRAVRILLECCLL